MTVSVAMAAYNGEEYIKNQIDSILSQLHSYDELIISVDESSDRTLEIIKSLQSKDDRIKVFKNPYAAGVVKNFQNAVENCSGDIIFFADQDDIWMPNKIKTIREKFNDKYVAAVIHDAKLTDSNLNVISPSTFKLRGGVRTSFLGNFIRLSFIGCCMAFRAAYKDVVLPIPTIYRSHDWWTGCLLACGKSKVLAVHEPLILHRIHENNQTPKKRPGVRYQLQIRWIILKNIIFRYRQKFKIDRLLKL